MTQPPNHPTPSIYSGCKLFFFFVSSVPFRQKDETPFCQTPKAMEQLQSNPDMINQATEAMKNMSSEACMPGTGWGGCGCAW